MLHLPCVKTPFIMKGILFALFLTFLLSNVPASAQDGFVDGVELTTTKAPWTLRVLGNDLDLKNVQAKPDEQSAYFLMASESSKLNVSVFIEPVDKCKTSDACRDHVLGLGNPKWGKYQDLAKGAIKGFSYFEFYRPEVDGRPVKMLDMYAQYVGDGYWADVHISKVLFEKEDRKLFERLLNSIEFVPKTKPGSLDAQVAKAEASVSSWLGLWDAGKCPETYKPLSPITRAELKEKDWVDFCTKAGSFLGTKTSRKRIATAFTRSLPGKTDRPVAIVAYHSNFSNRQSVVELVALLLENNGSWTITNYLPR